MNNLDTHKGPLLVLDSGLGGLFTFARIQARLPNIPLVYFGDTAYAPYGDQEPDLIRKRVTRILETLIPSKSLCGIVVACNTVAAIAHAELQSVQRTYGIPVWTIVQAATLLLRNMASRSKDPVVVLATTNMHRSKTFQTIGEQVGLSVTVEPCPTFVPLLESPLTTAIQLTKAVHTRMDTLQPYSSNTRLLYGCTHYPLLQKEITNLWKGKPARDPAEALADLITGELLAKNPSFGERKEKDCVLVSGDKSVFSRQMNIYFPHIAQHPEQSPI